MAASLLMRILRTASVSTSVLFLALCETAVFRRASGFGRCVSVIADDPGAYRARQRVDFNPRCDFRGDSNGGDPEAQSATWLQIERRYEFSCMILVRLSSNKMRK